MKSIPAIHSAPAAPERPRVNSRLALAAAATLGLSAAALPAHAAPGCTAAEYRQLDFFAGDWEAWDAKGASLGTAKVEKILGGCALVESFTAPDGGLARGAFSYDASRKLWTESFANDGGFYVHVEGRAVGNTVYMTGPMFGADGIAQLTRTSFEPKADGTIYHVFKASGDGGATWGILWEGTFRKRK